MPVCTSVLTTRALTSARFSPSTLRFASRWHSATAAVIATPWKRRRSTPLYPLQRQLLLYSSTKTNNSSTAPLTSTRENFVATSSDGVTGRPIDFDTAAKIQGNESQIVTITLEPGQVLRAESGAMMYMTEGVEMKTSSGGGLSAGFQRMLTGQGFFISDYTYTGPTVGRVALGTDFPAKIIRLAVADYGDKLVCQKGALLCASHTIDVQMEFTKNLSTGFFGGEGFVLQGLTGQGDVFLKAGGTLIRRELKVGEVLRISSGCLVAFSNGIDYGMFVFIGLVLRANLLLEPPNSMPFGCVDVQMIKGFANVFAGGEGLFITTLTGPGVVWLQGQPPQRMISEIARRVPSGGGIGIPIIVGGGGSGEGAGDGGDAK
jgi:uncharacterized protein (TIGR00266 family)